MNSSILNRIQNRAVFSTWFSLVAFFALLALYLLLPRMYQVEAQGLLSIPPSGGLFPSTPVRPPADDPFGKLPLAFEMNQGQVARETQVVARGSGYRLELKAGEAALTLRKSTGEPRGAENRSRKPVRRGTERPAENTLRMSLVGANGSATAEPLGQLITKSNYLIGKDQSKWQTDIANYAQVKYRSIYPGIDVLYYGNQQQLEYDFTIAPGAKPDAIRLAFAGADRVEIAGNGDLVLHMAGGELRQSSPLIYQDLGKGRSYVNGKYVALGAMEIGFEVGEYDQTKPLVIDPILAYSTYLNFYAASTNGGLAMDAAGNSYVTGSDGDIVYVAKLNATGTALVYTTHIGGEGGNGLDQGTSIAVDANGNAYVSGEAYTNDFPTVNAYQPVRSNVEVNVADCFVLKLNPAGAGLAFSTFLGGSSDEANFGIALDAAANVYVTGLTDEDTFPDAIAFPTHNAYQPTHAGGIDGFLAKFDASGGIVYATLLGGSDYDYVLDVAVDTDGAAYVTGQTYSTDFPTANPLQPALNGLDGDMFVTKFAPNGATLTYSTYLGGAAEDLGWGIALDTSKNIYLTGYTRSANFPTVNPFQATSGSAPGGRDAFVTKLNSAGSGLVYSTYLGGSSAEEAADIKINAAGAAYVVGFTASNNFPLVNAIQTTNNASEDAFVTKVNPDGASLGYSTYLGGSTGFGGGPGQGAPDFATAVVVDNSGNAYIFGETYATDFPLVTPLQSTLVDYRGAFLTRMNEGGNQTFYSIGGFIESNVGNRLANVTVTLSGSQTATALTDAIGRYTFSGLAAGGTYTVTPTHATLTFDPLSQTFANLSTNQTADFMQAPRSYHIEGRITDGNGQGIPNVILAISGYLYPIELYTDADGYYLVHYLAGNRQYTITPRHPSYSFAPLSRSFLLNSNQLATNFTGISNAGLSVSLTAPVNGATHQAPANITVSADAASTNSTVSRVEFFANGNSIGTDTAAPYSIVWTGVAGGQYLVSALVTDALGATKASTGSNIIVNSENGPTVAITAPVNNATLYSGRYITISANASSASGAIVKVEFFEGMRRLGQDTTGSPYLLDYYLYAGTYDLTAVATDTAGAVTRSAIVHLTVANNQYPVAAITSPANNSVFDVGVSVPITATANDPDGTVTDVKFFVGSTLIGTDTTAPYSATWNSAQQGIHALVVRVTDDQGGISYSNPVDIQVGNRAPSVVILSPSSGTQFTAPATITFSAQGFDPDGTVTQVEFFANGQLVGTDTTAPYSVQWTNVAAGNYDLITKVTDDDGATAVSQYAFIRVFANVPTVAITSPAPGATFAAPATIGIEVNASTADPLNPINYVAFYSSGQNLGFDSTAPYTLDWSNVSAGTYTLTVVATDSHFAETTSAPVTIEVTGNVGNWQLQVPQIIGTTGGALQDVEMVSANEGWAVGNAGSIFHTINGGVSWDLQHLDDTAPLNAVSFFDSQRGIAIGNAPFYTTNGGATWLPGAGMLGSFYGLDFVDANTAFAAGGGGITMKTTDGGQNWILLPNPIFTSNNLVSIDFVDVSNGWAVGANGMIIATTNGGTNWTIQTSGITGFFAGVNFVSPLEGWAVAGNVVLHTTNGGQTWTQQTVPTGTWLYDVHFINAQMGWGAGSQENIIFTDNGGQTWTTLRGGSGSEFSLPLWSVDFADPQHGVAVGNSAVISTADGGQTWTRPSNDFHSVSNRLFALDAQRVWSANSAAEVLYSINGGGLWSRATLYTATPNSQVTDVVFTDGLNGWATVNDGPPGFIYRSTSGGQSWQNVGAPASASLATIGVVDGQTLVAAGNGGAILRSSNGGTSWVPVTSPVSVNFTDLDFVTASTGWLVGSQGKILKTTDGGQTWVAQTSGLDTSTTLLSVSFADADNGWTAGGDVLLHTTDGGQTWTGQTFDFGATVRAVQAISPQTAWIVGSRSISDNYVAQTTDGGAVWVRDNFNGGASFKTGFFLDENNGWAGGSRFTSSDEGRIYRRTGSTPAPAPLAIALTSPADGSKFDGTPITLTAEIITSEGLITQVDFYDGNTLIASDNAAPYTYTWSGAAVGTHMLTARATVILHGDNTASFARPVSVSVATSINAAPTVSLTSPINNAAYGVGAGIPLTASAADSDGTISRVEFYSSSILIATDNSTPFQTTWTGAQPGTYQLTAVAVDNVGAPTTSNVINVNVRFNAGSRAVADFDGDGKTDVSVFRGSSGDWYFINSSDGAFRAQHWGASGDLSVPADFDGDGKTDTAVWRADGGNWYMLLSGDGSFRSQQWGQLGDIPVAGDYDGDGKADVGVYRPSTANFYLQFSSDNSFQFRQWGLNGDIPLAGDYDGDGKSDFAVFRPSAGAFYSLNSSDGAVRSHQFGQSGDKPIAGDFDGDGKTDLAVFRPTNGGWYFLHSSDGSFKGTSWGSDGDLAAAGDYDGDGKWDVGVFRPSTGSFYILRSGNGSLQSMQFGTAGDVPLAGSFVR